MKKVSIEKALAYLYFDDETLTPEEMVEAIYKMSLKEPHCFIDYIDGVYVAEAFENTLSCKNFIDMCYDSFANLKLAIDSESVNIYFENGEDEEPTHVVYWHIDEVEEDSSVAISIANAIDLYHSNPRELMNKLNIPQEIWMK